MARELSIVGAGLAGALIARLLAQRGWKIDLYERRADPRSGRAIGGRSINLALSERGWNALRMAGLEQQVAAQAIAMRGRAVHSLDGHLDLQPYGLNDQQVIHSVHRANLNRLLVSAAADAGVRLHFDHALRTVDWENSHLYLDTPQGPSQQPFAAVVGADGAGSPLRAAMIAAFGLEEEISWEEHGYKELSIRPGGTSQDPQFRLDPHALHIWPRGQFMLIALPNADRSFTVTLFLPLKGEKSFDKLTTEEAVAQFFQSEFPSAVPYLEDLQQEFVDNQVGPLATLRLSPWHHQGRALLIGDAAHAVVPFHGQGMNCAFEDCAELADLLCDECDLAPAFAEFYRRRKDNADAIAAMAVENYYEMRDHVARADYQWAKQIEAALARRFPQRFLSRYAQVSFTRLPYAEARHRGAIQSEIIQQLAQASSLEEIDWQLAEQLIAQRLQPLPSHAQLLNQESGHG